MDDFVSQDASYENHLTSVAPYKRKDGEDIGFTMTSLTLPVGFEPNFWYNEINGIVSSAGDGYGVMDSEDFWFNTAYFSSVNLTSPSGLPIRCMPTSVGFSMGQSVPQARALRELGPWTVTLTLKNFNILWGRQSAYKSTKEKCDSKSMRSTDNEHGLWISPSGMTWRVFATLNGKEIDLLRWSYGG